MEAGWGHLGSVSAYPAPKITEVAAETNQERGSMVGKGRIQGTNEQLSLVRNLLPGDTAPALHNVRFAPF
jgi:hypothetical protein